MASELTPQRFTSNCALCHQGAKRATAIEDPGIPERWLHRARFDHHAHRFVRCLHCHDVPQDKDAKTPDYGQSKAAQKLKWTGRTKDIMLPSIDTCRQCHASNVSDRPTASTALAPHKCSTCHTYHSPIVRAGEGRPLTGEDKNVMQDPGAGEESGRQTAAAR